MKAILFSALLASTVLFSGCGSSNIPHGSPVGPFVATVGQTSNNLFNFKGSDSGAISQTASSATGPAPSAVLIFSPDTFENHVYVTDSSSKLSLINMDSDSGALSPTGSSVAVGSNPIAITSFNGGASPSSPQPQFGFIYVLNQGSSNISVFQITDRAGNLSAVPGSPFATQPGPKSVAVTEIGNTSAFTVFVYVANGALGTISGFRVNSDGSLTELPGSPVAAGGNISWVATHLSFLYASDAANNTVIGLKIQSDGSLAAVAGSPFAAGSQPGAIAANLFDTSLYVVNQASNSVSGYAVDPVQGTLTPLAGSPYSTGTNPVYVAISSKGQVYVANHGSNSISAFTRDFNTGVLTPVAGSPFSVPTSPNWIDTLFIMNVD